MKIIVRRSERNMNLVTLWKKYVIVIFSPTLKISSHTDGRVVGIAQLIVKVVAITADV